MDEDKAREYVSDVMASDENGSNCCGASMYQFGDDYICTDCKEHCEPAEEE
mgnify:CR=1 FL=1